MKEEYFKSISIIEENFEASVDQVEKWKNAHFREYDYYYQEMFDVMRSNLKTLNAHKVQCWLEISAYYFSFKSRLFNAQDKLLKPLEIDK